MDYELAQIGPLLYDALYKYHIVFCSSNPNAGIDTGKKLHDEINRQLQNCDIFVAIVTENYLRSPHCIYEMSVARYLQKKTPIIIYANDDVSDRIRDIANTEWISITLNKEASIVEGVHNISKVLKISDLSDQNKIELFLRELSKIVSSNRPYFGMTNEVYNKILSYCQKEGITMFGKGSVFTKDEMESKFSCAKEVYIVATTGAGLLKTLKEIAIIRALKNKAKINILLPDRNSKFCCDVAIAESSRSGYGPVIAEQNRYRIEAEFVATFQYLNEAVCQAQEKYGNDIGEVWCYSTQTLLRQTIVLVISDHNTSWGWMNMTMAPFRTADTPNIAISDSDANRGLDNLIVKHCKCIIKIACERKAFRKINGNTRADKLDITDHEQYWRKKKEMAEERMKKRKELSDKVLIEVAAQHPLDDGLYPNQEFQKRLDMALQLNNELGAMNVWFYVPGSRHKFEGDEDKITLSQAGKNYLLEHGIQETHIYGDEANIMIKGKHGVYNSADESFVASQLFIANSFGRMICICSPNQTLRKTFYYMEFGLIPECYGIPNSEIFHDVVSEYFNSLHHTVYEDHDWQDMESAVFINSRKDRMP